MKKVLLTAIVVIMLIISTIMAIHYILNRKMVVACKKSYGIVRVYKANPTNIHQEISPRYIAILSNLDTITCNKNTRVGDSVIFMYYKKLE